MDSGIPIDMMLAAQGGDAFAQFDVAIRYLRGDGVQQSYDKALAWLHKAASQGHSRARFNIGSMYLAGTGLPKDPPKALTWYEAAFENADPGMLFNMGLIVEKNHDELKAWHFSVRCYQAAADAGSADAQMVLGARLLLGTGIEQQTDLGMRYLQRACEQGHANALAFVGRAYECGDVVEPDLIKAAWYYHFAESAGHPDAKQLCQNVAARMTSDQRAAVADQIRKTLDCLELRKIGPEAN